MQKNKVEIIISAKDKTSRAFKAASSHMASMSKRVMNLKTAIIGLGSAYASISAIKGFMRLADEQAKAVAGMETALKSMGRYTPEFSKHIQNVASSLQTVTNYGDETTLAGQKMLLTYKDISDELMGRSTAAMLDLAALMGGDVTSAANMLGKASMGMTGELRRAGITVDANTFKLGGYAGVLKAIEGQVKGQARAQREATGSWIAVGNEIGDVKEKIGDFFKIVTEPAAAAMLDYFSELNTSLIDMKESGQFDQYIDDISTNIMHASGSALIAIGKVMQAIEKAVAYIQEHETMAKYGLVGWAVHGKKGLVAGLGLGFLKEEYGKAEKQLESAPAGMGIVDASRLAAGQNVSYKDKVYGLIPQQQGTQPKVDKIKKLTDSLHEMLMSSGKRMLEWKPTHGVKETTIPVSETSTEIHKKVMDELIKNHTDGMEKIEEITNTTFGQDMANAITGWGSHFSSTLNDMLWDADATFGDIVESFAKMLTQMMIQKAVVDPILGSFTGWLNNSAKGNVFQDGNLIPFARGGVVSKPVIFPMANGMGLMGEAGPEAVMPLTRTSGGDLGVKAVSQGVTVNVINNTQSEINVEQKKTGNGMQLIQIVVDEIADNISRGGNVGRMIKSTFGLNRAGVVR